MGDRVSRIIPCFGSVYRFVYMRTNIYSIVMHNTFLSVPNLINCNMQYPFKDKLREKFYNIFKIFYNAMLKFVQIITYLNIPSFLIIIFIKLTIFVNFGNTSSKNYAKNLYTGIACTKNFSQTYI